VNGLPSSDKQYGWGGPDGYLFQKAYVEFFCSEENLKKLLEVLDNYPSISYHALMNTTMQILPLM
jgi:methylenetetrahydrofolate reductase (NADPH)